MSDLDYTPGPDDAYYADMWALELEAQRVGREDRLEERGGLTAGDHARRCPRRPSGQWPEAPAVNPPRREAA